MKIGLLRHFRVENEAPKICNSEEYDQACFQYDRCEIIENDCPTTTEDYSICYCSSLKRAVDTARRVFNKEIIPTAELAEVPIRAIFKTTLRLPFALWNIINRIGWLLNFKILPETRKQTKKRAARFLNKILESDHKSILIVSHGFFMLTLQEELIKRGFKGDRIINARHGRLYEFNEV